MRGKKREKRLIEPDLQYGSVIVTKFINQIMHSGKKEIARRVMHEALQKISSDEKQKNDPLEIFESAIKNVSPELEVRSRRIGGANYQVPMPVPQDRKITLAMRWIISAAKNKKGKSMAEKLAEEFILASKNEGAAIKKKSDTQRMAEANKAFAHFARY